MRDFPLPAGDSAVLAQALIGVRLLALLWLTTLIAFHSKRTSVVEAFDECPGDA